MEKKKAYTIEDIKEILDQTFTTWHVVGVQDVVIEDTLVKDILQVRQGGNAFAIAGILGAAVSILEDDIAESFAPREEE